MRVTKQDLLEQNAALRRSQGALQEYVTMSVREKHPDVSTLVTLECGDVHRFELWGPKRASGGVLLHVHKVDGEQAYTEVLFFDDALTQWSAARRAAFLHDDSYKIFDAIDRIKDARWEILNTPACAASMGCLCAGHARGNDVHAACDTSEGA